MSKFKIRHTTKYSYEVPVRDSANQIMLYPLKDDFQEVSEHSIWITGFPMVEKHIDYFGNEAGTFTHTQPHQELIIDSRLVVITTPKELPNDSAPADEQWASLDALKYQPAYIDFLHHDYFSGLADLLAIVAAERFTKSTPLVAATHLCDYVYKNFKYKKGITTVETTLDEVWSIKTGVCQDFAQILLAFLRHMNIPSRYVSGYICANKSNMRGEGATHAWVEAWIPFYGWLGLDPTNNCIVNEAHVRLAVGRGFADCSPVKGTYRGISEHTLEVAVSVAYEDGVTQAGTNEVEHTTPITSHSNNSYRRHQEMQMQQQQQ
jgi:transglutaminase-like putative cysteine protease